MILRYLYLSFLAMCFISHNTQAQSTFKAHKGEFDFWIGEWNVYKYGTDTLVGVSKIESILSGGTIKETYHSSRGNYAGTSLSKYNAQEQRWEQYYVDNGGLTLHITGELEDGKMILANKVRQQESDLHNRITWSPDEDGVRQTWDTSSDGLSWTTVFDGYYRQDRPNLKSLITRKGEGKTWNIFGLEIVQKISTEDTDDSYAVIMSTTPPGSGPPLHIHQNEEEIFYVVKGEYEFSYGEEIETLRNGDMIILPRGIPHGFKNIGSTDALLLNTISPGGFEKFFDEVDELPKDQPIDPKELAFIAGKYGLVFVK